MLLIAQIPFRKFDILSAQLLEDGKLELEKDESKWEYLLRVLSNTKVLLEKSRKYQKFILNYQWLPPEDSVDELSLIAKMINSLLWRSNGSKKIANSGPNEYSVRNAVIGSCTLA